MNSGSSLSLSNYDQSLGVGLPSLFRMLCYDYVPDVERLALSLGKALSRFPRYATRIVRTREGSKLVPLEEPLALEVRPAVSWWTPDSFRLEHLPMFVKGLETISGQPVLAVTLTPVSNGAVLSASFSHAVGDMYSFYLFMLYWAEQFELVSDNRDSMAQKLVQPVFSETEISKAREPNGELHLPDIKYEYTVVSYDREFLDLLREELAIEQGTPTLNEALIAFIVHRYGRKIMGRTTGLRLRVPVNVRGIHPAVPSDFIGNAIVEAIVALDEIIDSPVAARRTASQIRETVNAVRKKEYLESILEMRDGKLEFTAKGFPIYDRETDILSTSLSGMHFYKLDFGNGPPTRYFGMSTSYKGFSIASAVNGRDVHIFSEQGSVLPARRSVGVAI